jgi:hypothetical protein
VIGPVSVGCEWINRLKLALFAFTSQPAWGRGRSMVPAPLAELPIAVRKLAVPEHSVCRHAEA